MILSYRVLSLRNFLGALKRIHKIWVCPSSIILLLDILDRLQAGQNATILTLLGLLTGGCLLHHVLNP